MNPKSISFKVRFLVSLIAISIGVSLRYIDHGKGAVFLRDHIWLVVFLPLVLIFALLFLRSYYLQYKQ